MRLVNASLQQGHETYVIRRPEIGVDIENIQMMLSFKKQGARLVIGSFSDHRSLVEALKQVDMVICAVFAVHIRSHQILLQLNLSIPSKMMETLSDPTRMADALEPWRVTFDEKIVVRKAIEDVGIPFSYVSANCFAGYMVGGSCQPGHLVIFFLRRNSLYMWSGFGVRFTWVEVGFDAGDDDYFDGVFQGGVK